MHNLTTTTALGGTTPRVDTIGTVTITEQSGVALASIASRRGGEKKTLAAIKSMIKTDAPAPGHAAVGGDYAVFWTGPDQWMVAASNAAHEMLADELKHVFKDAASITEQTGAWVQFDVAGDARIDMLERLTALPVRTMQGLDANRTRIEQMGCFVLCFGDVFGIVGPRASAKSLHHALVTAAQSVA